LSLGDERDAGVAFGDRIIAFVYVCQDQWSSWWRYALLVDAVAVVLIIVGVADVIVWVVMAMVVVVLVVLVAIAMVMYKHLPGRVSHFLLFELVQGLPLHPPDSTAHLSAVEILNLIIKYS
jgi:hypothetical protein